MREGKPVRLREWLEGGGLAAAAWRRPYSDSINDRRCCTRCAAGGGRSRRESCIAHAQASRRVLRLQR